MINARPGQLGRPKDLEKRAALLEAAGALFCAHGFDSVSLDAIAQAAGVSKLTIYSHFGDKDGLFSAAVEARCQDQLPHGLFNVDEALPLEAALRRIGHAFVALVYSDDAVQLMRMIAGQASASTRLARLYFAAGPKRALEDMEQFLRGVAERRTLAIDDPMLAASQFFALLKGVGHMRCLLGLEAAPSAAARSRHIDQCVQLFLKAYAPASALAKAPAPAAP